MTVYKLLFVEDKKQAVDMLRANLKDEPFELYFAYNGIEGEMQFERIKPHLVLLDINPVSYTHLTLPTILLV